MRWHIVWMLAGLLLVGCNQQTPQTQEKEHDTMGAMNEIADHYVKLVLALGQHDAAYVDAYYGPESWRTAAETEKKTLAMVKQEAGTLLAQIEALPTDGLEPIAVLRHHYLCKQLASMGARIAYLEGEKLSFDEEAARLYDAKPPHHDAAHFEALLGELEGLLPGEGDLAARLAAFREAFIIPKDKLDTVFKAAVAEGRKRTAAHIDLPENESFVVEYVTDKSWSGYNWYKGNAHSLIQVNTDFPIYIDRAVDLACHEGYPGHHVYNALLEKHLVVERGWREFSVYALFSPQSLIAEGSANYGIEMAFPAEERITFEKEVLFPLAGIDPAGAANYYQVMAVVARLNYAGNEAARAYLNGTKTREEAIDWLVTYALSPRDRATQRLRFIDDYRAYVINYNLGQDLVAAYVEGKGGTVEHPEKRWEIFKELLSSPRLPSGLTP